MTEPLVTVVTPSFNQGRFIRATIESVLSQDYPNLEYIIMDGGSTDETASVVAEYSSRLKWISEPDNGQSHAINKGFRMAKGEIVSWLNSDDIYLPGAVRRAVEELQRNTRAGAVYGEGYLIDRDGAIKEVFPHTQPLNLWRLAHLSDYILQQTVFFRKRVFEEVGYLDEDLHYTMDWDILIRIGKRFEIAYIPEFMGCLREYAEAKSFSGGLRRVREIHRMLRRHTGKLLPLGSIVYGLDALHGPWSEQIAQWAPGFARDRVRALLRTMCGMWIGKVLVGSQGWYSDGWASTVVHYLLPSGHETIRIAGELPDTGGLLDGQQIRVIVNGKTLTRLPIPLGEFVHVVDVPASFVTEPLEIQLKASRFMLPQAVAGNSNCRRLCYRLRSIGHGPSRGLRYGEPPKARAASDAVVLETTCSD